MLIGGIPEQIMADFKSKLPCGTSLGSLNRIKNMHLPEVMVLLHSVLEEGDAHSFWDLVNFEIQTSYVLHDEKVSLKGS